MSAAHKTSQSGPDTNAGRAKLPLSSQVTNTTPVAQTKPLNPAVLNSKATNGNAQQKKVPRRSSKPIINWFQRKLAGSGKAKGTNSVPLRVSDFGLGRSPASTGHQMGRITSSPLPVPNAHLRQQCKLDGVSAAKRKTRSISLHGEDELRDMQHQGDNVSLDQSSLNRESLSTSTLPSEADEDASVRPIPPSSPPSPVPSRDSSSYLSDPRTFRSMAASTKPTTLLSIDLNANGMAHIAQAPMNPPTPLHRFAPHVRQSSSLSGAGLMSSGASITFSSLPSPQPGPGSRSNSLRHPNGLGPVAHNIHNPTQNGHLSSVQAPLHTTHHPRNNPRPSSPPMDNASVLTLASSAFGITSRSGPLNYPPSAVGDSLSQYGSVTFLDAESTSQYVPGDEERLEERDFDASVRALRPRSSRRGSWESEASRWSARGAGTPSLARDRSLWASNSVRTGQLENGETYEVLDDDDTEEYEKNGSLLDGVSPIDPPSIMVELSTPQVEIPRELEACMETKGNSGDADSKQVTTRASVDTIAQPANAPEVESITTSPTHAGHADA
ncbi:hypothetical protein D9619_000859 [Psilocybe cf. subviscida]|uniref:Uncharacterized protein n=1 Tax=Psilocybe cf. subviscida TaxID=2480587 RepID=A0A8H5BCX0_9AGAR|nr:hypothetical protein D9619_000859 [Psilocybe cf. subviscida]